MRAFILLWLFLWLVVPRSAAAYELESAVHPVRVVWEGEGLEALAASVLAAAETAWHRQFVELGYTAPYTEHDGGPPEPGMVFHLADTGMGAGSALVEPLSDVPDTAACDCSSVITLDAATDPDSPLVAEGVFHELNHAAQYARDCTEPPSALEAFTIALLESEFPASTIVPWVISQFQAFPEFPLNYWTMEFPCSGLAPCFPYQLGSALFPLYLRDRFGGGAPSGLAELWSRFGQDGTVTVPGMWPSCSAGNAPDWFEAIDAYLMERGSSFDAAFTEFSAWRAITGEHDDGAHYVSGERHAAVTIARRHSVLAEAPVSLELHEYGSRYLELEDLDLALGRPLQVAVEAGADGLWSGSVLLWRSSGPVETIPVVFNGPVGHAEFTMSAGIVRCVAVVSWHHHGIYDADSMNYSRTGAFSFLAVVESEDPDPDAGPDTGSDTGQEPSSPGGGCSCSSHPAPAPRGPLVFLALLLGFWQRKKLTSFPIPRR